MEGKKGEAHFFQGEKEGGRETARRGGSTASVGNGFSGVAGSFLARVVIWACLVEPPE